MTQQEHGCHAFLALLREAVPGTEIPLRAWRSGLRAAALEPVDAGLVAMPTCVTRLRPHEAA